GRDRWLEGLQVPMLGPHQAGNGAVAVAAVQLLSEAGFPVSEDALRRGLAAVRWPGRMELYPGKPALLFDGAHNAEGAQVLAEGIRALFPGQRPVFVLGMLDEKPIDAMLRILLPLGQAAVFTAARVGRGTPADPGDLARRAQGLVPSVGVERDPLAAGELARRWARPDGLVCVSGSLYLVGELQGLLAGELRGAREYLSGRRGVYGGTGGPRRGAQAQQAGRLLGDLAGAAFLRRHPDHRLGGGHLPRVAHGSVCHPGRHRAC